MEMDLVAEAIVVMAQKGSTKIFFLYFFLLYKCFVEVPGIEPGSFGTDIGLLRA